MNAWLIGLYALDYLCIALYVWVNYLDVRWTLKDIGTGRAREQNPKMAPYVKAGDPWLMWRGKIRNGAWVAFVCLVIPVGPLLLIGGWKIYQAMRTSQATYDKVK